MHPMIQRRLRIMLEQVLAIAPTERRPSVEQRIATLGNAARSGSAWQGLIESDRYGHRLWQKSPAANQCPVTPCKCRRGVGGRTDPQRPNQGELRSSITDGGGLFRKDM